MKEWCEEDEKLRLLCILLWHHKCHLFVFIVGLWTLIVHVLWGDHPLTRLLSLWAMWTVGKQIKGTVYFSSASNLCARRERVSFSSRFSSSSCCTRSCSGSSCGADLRRAISTTYSRLCTSCRPARVR